MCAGGTICRPVVRSAAAPVGGFKSWANRGGRTHGGEAGSMTASPRDEQNAHSRHGGRTSQLSMPRPQRRNQTIPVPSDAPDPRATNGAEAERVQHEQRPALRRRARRCRRGQDGGEHRSVPGGPPRPRRPSRPGTVPDGSLGGWTMPKWRSRYSRGTRSTPAVDRTHPDDEQPKGHDERKVPKHWVSESSCLTSRAEGFGDADFYGAATAQDCRRPVTGTAAPTARATGSRVPTATTSPEATLRRALYHPVLVPSPRP